MKYLLAMLIVLVGAGLAPGSQLVLLAGEPCLQQYNFRAYCPFTAVMDPNDPNGPTSPSGSKIPVLTPIASTEQFDPCDLATWERPVGRWYREAPICLPVTGWSLDGVRCIDGTSIPTVTYDKAAMTWSLATDVRQGPNWWAIEATSRNVADPRITKSRIVFVTALGILDDMNAAPILAAIERWLEAS